MTNTYPRLPVREGEHVVVRIGRFDDIEAFDDHQARLSASAEWKALAGVLSDLGDGAPTTLRLAPASRSMMR